MHHAGSDAATLRGYGEVTVSVSAIWCYLVGASASKAIQFEVM